MQPSILTPKKPHPILFYWIGIVVLILNKIRYGARGYKDPRPFSPRYYTKAIAYDQKIVAQWLEALNRSTGQSIEGKTVLELGPGADLGTAVLLLDKGAKNYITIDTNRLIDQTPPLFYEELTKTLQHGEELKNELMKTLSGKDQRIRYLVDPNFNLSLIEKASVDLVVSQAAFEHFSDVGETIKQLSTVIKPEGTLIAEIDLMTHTGFIRSRDPLNIFRYSARWYTFMNFPGIPNRLRPKDYKRLLEDHGWKEIEITPLQRLTPEYVQKIEPQLNQLFQKEDADMHILTFLLKATKI